MHKCPSQSRTASRRGLTNRAGQRVALLAALVGVACAPGEPPSILGVEAFASPAGVGSGEPFLSSVGDTVLMSWLEAVGSGAYELRHARMVDGAWSEARMIAASDRFFVNWADFPSINPGPGGTLWAHWLERGPSGGYDYGVRIVRSDDGGATWSEPWRPHDDDSPTEHGFVSAVPTDGGLGFLWLDGRGHAPGASGSAPTQQMALYFRGAGAMGAPGPETLVDARVCDCCQTDMALTSVGPIAVYRDRSPEEIRDIRVVRRVDGAWTEGVLVHDDGWETGACPVNGPAVAAQGARVAVAWFTAAGQVPRVNVAFSDDAGASFGAPVVVDDGNPAGRVDVLMVEDGSVLVSWLERTGGEGAEVRVRAVHPGGSTGESVSISASSSERASGFPRIVATGSGAAMVAWTDVTEIQPQVRVARLQVGVREGT